MLTTAGIMMIGVMFDIAVVYYAGGLELFDEEHKEIEESTKALNRYMDFFFMKLILSSEQLFCRIDKLKESSEYNVVYGSHVSLTKDSAFKS